LTCAATAGDTFGVFGTTATLLLTAPDRLVAARAIADAELAAVDRACSRFRPDSELSAVNAAGGASTRVSELFAEILAAALRAAELTGGDVDPTCGRALVRIGYDRDFELLLAAGGGPDRVGGADPDQRGSRGSGPDPDQRGSRGSGPTPDRRGPLGAVPGWRSVRLDRRRLRVRLGSGAQLDLGATAKAWAADRCAGVIAAETGAGALVSLGGDIAVAGPPPPDGWRVRVTDDHAAGPGAPGQTVAVSSGGLATSSTTVRAWDVAGRRMHHIIDPATGEPARSCWRTVSVAAGSCLDANTASTAAIIRSRAAPRWLRQAGLPARLVAEDGSVETTAGWPQAPAEAA
jgi:FAD:protein FMN transferase